MDKGIIEQLSAVTEEEREILQGRGEIDRSLYTEERRLIVDSKKMLEHGKLIRIRPHTRFIHFPSHSHNYVEVIYMCKGETTHIVDGTTVVLKEGELLFLNQNAVQEILPAGEDDIGVNFIILPEFFDMAFQMMGEGENQLRDFLVGCLRSNTQQYARFLHFQVAGILPIQNLIENMVWTLLNNQPGKHSINQITMGLLFLQLVHYTDKIRTGSESYEQELVLRVLHYIEENYKNGELTELAADMGYDIYWLSRAIKRLTGKKYKELLQIKRLNQAGFLLLNSRIPVSEISVAVGYDNTSYFHRIFKLRYGMSPKEYRKDK